MSLSKIDATTAYRSTTDSEVRSAACRRSCCLPSQNATASQIPLNGAASSEIELAASPTADNPAELQAPIWSPPRYTNVSMKFLA